VGSAAREEFLLANQNADGGWGYFPGRQSRVEPTVYALRALGLEKEPGAKSFRFLASCQQPDGGFAPAADIPGSTWVTALVVPLLAQTGRKEALHKASDWLLGTKGAGPNLVSRALYLAGKSPIDQDPTLIGWPWRPGNSSWVEPTAHALVALRSVPDQERAAGRRREALAMLNDRRCEELGWNYGNKRVLNEVLPPYPETTGIALMGLASAGAAEKKVVAAASVMYGKAKGAYARAWLAWALQLSGERVAYELPDSVHPSRNIALAGLEMLAERGQKLW
jgi:hypothetical protein